MDTDTRFNPWKALEHECAPTRGHSKLPCLQQLKPVPPFLREVHVPDWTWKHPQYATLLAGGAVELDLNAAFISAASAARVAHGSLERTGRIEFVDRPGYWKLDFSDRRDYWGYGPQADQLMSPLGTNSWRQQQWVATPTAKLLHDQAEKANWAPLKVLDSWTSDQPVNLQKWTNAVRDHRARLIDTGDKEAVAAFKDDYVRVLQQLQKGGKGFAYFRPDWLHTIQATSAANTWRKLWATVEAGHGPIAALEKDAALYTLDDYLALQAMDKPVIKLDHTGKAFGSFKVKSERGPR